MTREFGIAMIGRYRWRWGATIPGRLYLSARADPIGFFRIGLPSDELAS
jgi:hypothetical protein